MRVTTGMLRDQSEFLKESSPETSRLLVAAAMDLDDAAERLVQVVDARRLEIATLVVSDMLPLTRGTQPERRDQAVEWSLELADALIKGAEHG